MRRHNNDNNNNYLTDNTLRARIIDKTTYTKTKSKAWNFSIIKGKAKLVATSYP